MRNKEIAIVLATYNGAKYLIEQLDSLLTQTFQDFVCYIHDDGSSDETNNIIDNYCKKYPNKFVVLDYPKVGSAKYNFISMIKYVNEPYLMFCDQDDVWIKDKVEKSYKKIKQVEKKYNNAPVLVFTDRTLVDENLNVIKESLFKYKKHNYKESILLNYLLIQNCGAGCTMIMNKEVYKVASKVENVDNIIMHDYWIALVASCIGYVYYLDETTILYRQHSDNVCGVKKYRNNIQKILDKCKEIHIGGIKEFIKKRKKLFDNEKKQALELVNIEDISEEKKRMVLKFGNISNMNKIQRISFLMKNNIKKEHNNFWLYLWI